MHGRDTASGSEASDEARGWEALARERAATIAELEAENRRLADALADAQLQLAELTKRASP